MVSHATPTARHPARGMSFERLSAGLDATRAARMVLSRFDPETGRQLWCYTNRRVYDDVWDEFSLLARGLILHPAERRIVATPFPKFFNAGERGTPIPVLDEAA